MSAYTEKQLSAVVKFSFKIRVAVEIAVASLIFLLLCELPRPEGRGFLP